MNDTEFQILFEAAQNGDIKALEELIDMFMPSMCKNSFISGNLDIDCLQELTIRFINCIRNFRFNNKEDFTDYLEKLKKE
ncbi:MAG: helix-turn-helix domain-containing protein [Tepidibacillus sp.]